MKHLAGKRKGIKTVALGMASIIALTSPLATVASYADEQAVLITENEAPAAEEAEAAKTVVEEINEATEAAKDVSISVPLGIINVEIPLEADVAIKTDIAETIVENAEESLEKTQDQVIEKLDQSVTDENGNKKDVKDDIDNSAIDDKTIDKLNDAESALSDGQQIISDALDSANEKFEAGIKTVKEAKELKEELLKAEEDAAIKLEEAEAEYEVAKDNYDVAKKAYDDAVKISNEAASKAAKELEKAQRLLDSASAKADRINNRLIAIDSLLTKADEILNDTAEKLDEKISEAKDNLDEAVDNLDKSIEKLKDNTEKLSDKVEVLGEELKDVEEATKDFVESIEDAYYTQKDLNKLYAEYDNAKKALESASKKLDEAKAIYDENGGKEAFDEAFAEFEKASNALESITKQYNEVKEFNEKLAKKVEDGEYNSATFDIVARYLSKDGYTVAIDQNGESGKYNDGESFVIVKDENGKIIARYSYELTEDNFNVKLLDTISPEGYYTLPDGTEVAYTKDGELVIGEKTVVVKGNDDDLYYEGDTVEHSSTINNQKAVKVTISDKFGLAPATYEISRLPIEKNDLGETAPYIQIGLTKYYVEPDGRLYTVDYNIFKGRYIKSKYNSFTLIKVGKVEYETIETVSIDGKTYSLLGDSETGYSYKDEAGNTVNLIKNDKDEFVIKNAVTKRELPDSEKEFILSDGDSSSSLASAANEYNEKYDAYNNAFNACGDAKDAYDEAKAWYEDYVTKLDSFTEAKSEAERTDLVVKREIDINLIITSYKNEIVYGDLADLPRGVLDAINLDGILKMDPKDREEVMKSLNTIISSDNQIEKIPALIDVISKMGGTKTDAYTALLIALGEDTTDEQLKNILSGVRKLPFGNDIANAIEKLVEQAGCATPFQEDYAKAWKAALDAKVNVVVSGVELAKEATEAVVASVEVLKAGVAEGAAITDVTIDALTVAVDGIILGGLCVGEDIVALADAVVVKLDDYVSELQSETQKAADEVAQAKEAVEKIKINNPGSEELAKALVALKNAEERLSNFEAELTKVQLDLETVKEKAEEADDTAKKLAKKKPAKKNDKNSDDDDNDDSSKETTEKTTIEVAQKVVEDARVISVSTATLQVVEAEEVEDEAEPVVLEEEETIDNTIPNKDIVTITDGQTPLSATAPAEEPSKFSWLWLLLIVLLIVAGCGTYVIAKKNSTKKQDNN